MRLSSFAGTDVGRTRSGNEDSYFCGRTVFAVADGLGGHQGGEVASAVAVAPLAALDGREFADPAEAAELAAIQEANAAIDQAASDPGLWGMGTTVTTAAVAGDRHLQLAHVGDSRAYLLRDGSLEQRTTDHTVVGELPPQPPPPTRPPSTPSAASSPAPSASTPHPRRRPRPPGPRPGDQVLLCSDGLPAEVVPDPIAELLTTGPDGDTACRALGDAANNAGGPDDITVVLIRVG